MQFGGLKKVNTRLRPKTTGRVADVQFIEVEVGEAARVQQMVIELGDGVRLSVGMEGIELAAALIVGVREFQGREVVS